MQVERPITEGQENNVQESCIVTVEDDSIVMQDDKELPGSIAVKSMKKTRSEENLHRIEDILLEMSFNGKNDDSDSSDKEIFAGIDPLR